MAPSWWTRAVVAINIQLLEIISSRQLLPPKATWWTFSPRQIVSAEKQAGISRGLQWHEVEMNYRRLLLLQIWNIVVRFNLPFPNPAHSWSSLQPSWSPGLSLWKRHGFSCQLLLWQMWRWHDLCSWPWNWGRSLAEDVLSSLSFWGLWQSGWVQTKWKRKSWQIACL